MKEFEEKPIKCRTTGCKTILHGKNEKDVGYCLNCYNEMMCDGSDLNDDDDFQPCSECDGHDACADFGCAIKAGLGHMLQKPL